MWSLPPEVGSPCREPRVLGKVGVHIQRVAEPWTAAQSPDSVLLLGEAAITVGSSSSSFKPSLNATAAGAPTRQVHLGRVGVKATKRNWKQL